MDGQGKDPAATCMHWQVLLERWCARVPALRVSEIRWRCCAHSCAALCHRPCQSSQTRSLCVPAGFPPCSEPGRRVYQVAPGPPMERNPCARSKLAVHAQAISGRYSALEGTREDMLFPGRRSGWRIRVDLVLDALTATGSRARPPGT